MKARASSSVMAVALALAPVAVMAEPGSFSLNPFVGYMWHDSTTDLDNSTIFGVGAEFQFTNQFGVELQYIKDNDAKMGGGGPNVDSDRFAIDGIYYTPRLSIFQPYLKLGVDHVSYDVPAGKPEGTEAVAGFGTRMLFNENWSARLEAKALHELDDSLTHGLVTFGISYAFNPPPKPVAAAPVVVPPPPPPAPVPVIKTEEMKLNILFATNKADITEQYAPEVERAANFLKKYPDETATIEGHTDSSGSDALNQKLSQRRADAVKNMLVDRYGIDASRVTAVGYGESRPVADNATKEGRAENRRVIAVMKGTKQEMK